MESSASAELTAERGDGEEDFEEEEGISRDSRSRRDTPFL